MKEMKCQFKNCRLEYDLKFPVILVWAKGFDKASHDPVSIEIEMPICVRCRLSITVQEFVSDVIWMQIQKMFRENCLARPDRKSMEMKYAPIKKKDKINDD